MSLGQQPVQFGLDLVFGEAVHDLLDAGCIAALDRCFCPVQFIDRQDSYIQVGRISQQALEQVDGHRAAQFTQGDSTALLPVFGLGQENGLQSLPLFRSKDP
ncbi:MULTISPECIES: hypothetical protein [unclassified Pseudomonas]|uniref:hypothetical protein n=1 Tax=unclassified Pseudomonas TaxID=196821 RepID=UPI00083955FE|nr:MULTISPECIES: hypothetical protein [unclassified Pseudomonas]QIH10521.1 hypothetical protein ATY02_29235 [Pseudomonas sp. BIOMIG1BAC]